MSQLQKIIYLTRQQYETLLSNNNTGQITYGGITLTGVQDDNIYFITDETVSATDLGDDFVLPVNKGGTGKTSFTVGSVLVGNGAAALTELAATDQNTANTIIKRSSTGTFSTTAATIGSILIDNKKLEPVNQINSDGANMLLGYKKSGNGVTASQWCVGTIDIQGVIRSNNTDLIHTRNGTNSTIIDTGNWTNNIKYLPIYEARGSTTSLNKSANYVAAGAMFHLIASSSTSATDNGKTPSDANILQMNWDNNGGYDSQLGISTSGSRMYFRSEVSKKTAWQEVAHAPCGTSNIGSATQPVYMTSAGVITAGTALKDLAYIAKPSSNTTTTYLRGDGSWVGLSDMGLSTAMHFIGVATVSITDGGTEDPKIGGNTTTVTAGDVVIDSDSSREYVWDTTGKWELLGGDESYWVSSTGTTGEFWRGDNTWSNIIKQTSTNALGIDGNFKIGTAIKDLHFSLGNGTGTGSNNGNGGGITFGTDTASYGGIYWQTSGSYGSRLHFATTSSFANGAYTRMFISHTGNVGINTVSPSYKLHVSGQTYLDNTTAASATNQSSQLIVSNSGSSGAVALELWRNANASWQIINNQGTLYIRNNYTTSKQTTYNRDGIIIDYNTGNTAIAGTLAIAQTTRTTECKLLVNGASILKGDLTLSTSSADSPDIVWWYGDTNKEQARIWMGSGGTAKWAPKYRCYNSSGTSLYSGNLVLDDGTGASGTWDISISGNATTATTATNLSAAPTITAAGTATVNLAANTTYTLTVGGKSVIFKTPADSDTNTLMNYTLGATTRAYLMGSQNAPATSTVARAAHGDLGVYLTNVAGQLSAKSLSINDGVASAASVEKVWMQWNATDQALEFVFA